MKELTVPAGQGDSGEADPGLAAVIGSHDLDRLPAVFARARLFVAVEPRLVEADLGTGADKLSEMVLVTLRRPDGATAVPAFSSVAALAAWRASARPVPVMGSTLAAEACRLGHSTVVLDIGGDGQVALSVETVTAPAPSHTSPAATASPAATVQHSKPGRASRLFRRPPQQCA